MIYGPKAFNLNEWVVLFSFFISVFIVFKLPRRFPASLTILFIIIGISVSRNFDHAIAGPPRVDLYDIMDRNKIEYFDLITYLFFGNASYLFIYLYDYLKLKGVYILLYILGWSLFSVGVEWGMVVTHVYTYKAWKIAYSFSTYLFVQPLTLLLYHYVMSHYKNSKAA